MLTATALIFLSHVSLDPSLTKENGSRSYTLLTHFVVMTTYPDSKYM